MTAWLDRVAADLLYVEHDVRVTLRSLSRGGRPPRLHAHNQLIISPGEARTLLRGVMPAPIAVTRVREPHARLVAALSIFSGHLITLNEPFQAARPENAIAAGCQLARELGHWLFVARWSSACRRAKVRLPLPVTSVMQLQTPGGAEHLPNAWAGARELEARGGGMARVVRTLRVEQVEQGELDLAPPGLADVVDLRQMRLDLVPPAREVRHGSTAA